MKAVLEQHRSYPSLLFFHLGTVEEGEVFFDEFWREARAVSDPNHVFYDAFGIQRASLRQLLGPGVWVKAARAMRQGHRQGRPVQDPWRMPGLFLVRRDRILWTWRFRHLGDDPDFGQLCRIFQAL